MPKSPRLLVPDEFAEKKTAKITATLNDEDGNPLALASINTLTLTLYDEITGTVINGRTGSNILNTGGGTLAATSGAFTLTLSPNDMAINDTDRDDEIHVALVEWTYNASADAGGKEIRHRILNLLKVT